MSTETPYNPYAAFENMADEDVVLKAKQEDNAHLPRNIFCINTVILCGLKPEAIF